MDLFVINRFDDVNHHKENTGKDEDAKLQKVLKKIKKRKIQRQKVKEKLFNLTPRPELAQPASPEKQTDAEELHQTMPELDEEMEKIPQIHETDDSKQCDAKAMEGFIILGSDEFATKNKAMRVLPKWLRNSTSVSMNLKNNVKLSKIIELDDDIKSMLKKNKIKRLFPIQAEFIPWQMEQSRISAVLIPQDVCVSAPTGSGKTLAYVLPIVQRLKAKLAQRIMVLGVVRVLVILPTQSLAYQIYKTFKTYCSGTELEVGIATGERSFAEEQKQLVLHNSVWGPSSKVDILVCTPGRLVEHIKVTEGFDLRNLEYLVIDEADRVLDSVQDDWLYHLQIHMRGKERNDNVLNLLSLEDKTGRPQKLLFSATLSQDPEKLQKLSLFQPKLFTCVAENESEFNLNQFSGKYTTPIELTEKYTVCALELKPLVLYKLINDIVEQSTEATRILIFTNSAINAHRLKVLLASISGNELKIGEISSSLTSIEERNTLMTLFQNGDVNILICTDSMTRGIDFPKVDCVISYNAPSHLKTYIHRAGRTARAGCTGLAITILQPLQKEKFLAMLKQAKKDNLEQINITDEELDPFTEIYKKSLQDLKDQITDETTNDVELTRKRKHPSGFKSHKKRRHIKK